MICQDLTIPANGIVTYSDESIPRAVGSTGSYSCEEGYQLSGTHLRTCGATMWSNSVDGTPTCTGKQRPSVIICFLSSYLWCLLTAICEELTLSNGAVVYNPSTTPRLEGAVAIFSCNTGYRPSSTNTRTCQSDGSWSEETVTCESELLYCCLKAIVSWLRFTVVDCGAPPIIENGSQTFPGTTFGETVTYTCDGIFVLSGTAILTCNGEGSWGDPPICSRNTEIPLVNNLLYSFMII